MRRELDTQRKSIETEMPSPYQCHLSRPEQCLGEKILLQRI